MSLSNKLEAELFDVDWQDRAQTILQTIGILAFGFMLGVHYMTIVAREAAPMLAYKLSEVSIQQPYKEAMLVGMLVAVVGICGAMLVEFRRRDDGE